MLTCVVQYRNIGIYIFEFGEPGIWAFWCEGFIFSRALIMVLFFFHFPAAFSMKQLR